MGSHVRCGASTQGDLGFLVSRDGHLELVKAEMLRAAPSLQAEGLLSAFTQDSSPDLHISHTHCTGMPW